MSQLHRWFEEVCNAPRLEVGVVADGATAAGRRIVTRHVSGPGLGVEPTGQVFRIAVERPTLPRFES